MVATKSVALSLKSVLLFHLPINMCALSDLCDRITYSVPRRASNSEFLSAGITAHAGPRYMRFAENKGQMRSVKFLLMSISDRKRLILAELVNVND